MLVEKLRELIADVPDGTNVIIATPPWSRLINPDGTPPLHELMGRFTVGADITGLSFGAADMVNYARLCIRPFYHADYTPCDSCQALKCNGKHAPLGDEEAE